MKEQQIPDWQQIEPLDKLTCTSSDCKNNLHSFLMDFRGKKLDDNVSYRSETCVDCGIRLIDWNKIDRRNLKDIEYIVSSLKNELFRSRYWEKPITDEMIYSSQRKGLPGLRKEVENRIRKDINKPHKTNPWDGRQTPLEDKKRIIFYAQHATATCCRKCIEEWYGINRDTMLSEDLIQFLTEVILYYIKQKIPSLVDDQNKDSNINTTNIIGEKT